MKQEVFISLYLDTRRAKANGRYPVKLRVYTPSPRKQKMYPTVFELTDKEFASVWETTKPRKEHKELRRQMQAVEEKATQVAEGIKPFSFEQFERQLYRKAGDGVRLQYLYAETIERLMAHKQIGTGETYQLSERSIREFVEATHRAKYSDLTLYDITPAWLHEYEYYMTEPKGDKKGKSLTTVSIYLRALRAIFNKAIDEGEIEKQYYPFGKRKYQLPASTNVKKALTKEQLGKLFQAEPETPEQERAKDFWFFSYACNGINFKDVALLRYRDISGDSIEFIRAKTRKTSKTNMKAVTAYLNDYALSIIEKYGNPEKEPDNLVFDIITDGLHPQEQHIRIKNFTRAVNQGLKRLCKANGLPENISTYWARHSFATNAVRNGATLEFIQESLGHRNLTTTQNYFAGFEDETKREVAQKLMEF